MKKIKPILIPILLYLILLPGWLQAGKVDKIVKEFQKVYRNARTLQIVFKQINRFSLTGIETETYGTLYLSGSRKFRLETEEQVIVSDGTTFWRWNKVENQVLIDLPKSESQEGLMRDFLYDLSKKYTASLLKEEKSGGKKVYVVKLVPKNADQSFFTQVKVWIQDKSWTLQRVVYVDYNDNETEYMIEKMHINPQLSDVLFQFTIPEGVEVVDLRP